MNKPWYGKSPSTGFLDRDSITPFVITTGGINTYGIAVQISNGAEIEGGSAILKGLFGKIFVTNVSVKNAIYKLEFWYGLTTFAAATLLSEIVFMSPANSEVAEMLDIDTFRIAYNNKIWARCKCAVANKKLSFLIDT